MKPIWIAMIFSFFSGVFGYIIARFWIRPIAQYRMLKQQISSSLKVYSNAETANRTIEEQLKDREEAYLRYAALLSESYTELPHWYRLILKQRKEFPLDASGHFSKLATIRKIEQAKKRVRQIKETLRL